MLVSFPYGTISISNCQNLEQVLPSHYWREEKHMFNENLILDIYFLE